MFENGPDAERDARAAGLGQGGEGAKLSLQVMTEGNNRGIDNAWTVVCDRLMDLPGAHAAPCGVFMPVFMNLAHTMRSRTLMKRV